MPAASSRPESHFPKTRLLRRDTLNTRLGEQRRKSPSTVILKSIRPRITRRFYSGIRTRYRLLCVELLQYTYAASDAGDVRAALITLAPGLAVMSFSSCKPLGQSVSGEAPER